MDGQVVTFYSYKGGSGRTMALANVAWILAANGKRVLVVDWNLEVPGLYRFFMPFIGAEALSSTPGLIQLIQDYEWATTRADYHSGTGRNWLERFKEHASVRRYSFSLDWRRFPLGATLDFLSSGQMSPGYVSTLMGLDWQDFYELLRGGEFVDALRADMKQHYDYVLIDSCSGLSDTADICTIHLPDTVVACFTLSDQNIDGTAQVARTIHEKYRERNIQILPVPMRVDLAAMSKADAGRALARRRFANLPNRMSDVERRAYWREVAVPYQTYYAYEELLATIADGNNTEGTLLYAYERLAGYITQGEVTALPPLDDAIRSRLAARFERPLIRAEDEDAGIDVERQ
ncbi:tyrosine-protein kinase family protein [Catellatospora chokoriensis]|uniref:Cellulose biosynthesis protein BcsQ n=1 Tax=Catellatospora chokoriensis TaxID=310353 RepID=A0A8J3K873_9ACTN|nr:AAA family ATPase [Catellatospora chokoriensis]GIF90264.1 hypothetical protein Cch02nite_37080 [Catellatospora chokoriensis]